MARQAHVTPTVLLLSYIGANQDKQIYLTNETWVHMKENSDVIPEKYRFLASCDNYVINGYECLRLDCVYYYENYDCKFVYDYPDEGEVLLL